MKRLCASGCLRTASINQCVMFPDHSSMSSEDSSVSPAAVSLLVLVMRDLELSMHSRAYKHTHVSCHSRCNFDMK
jgi:hypothetical protein